MNFFQKFLINSFSENICIKYSFLKKKKKGLKTPQIV